MDEVKPRRRDVPHRTAFAGLDGIDQALTDLRFSISVLGIVIDGCDDSERFGELSAMLRHVDDDLAALEAAKAEAWKAMLKTGE